MRKQDVSRRALLEAMAAAGTLAAIGASPFMPARARAATGVNELRGPAIDLTIGAGTVNVTGRPRAATLINGSLPGPLLRWREGDTATIRVRNALAEPTSLHWHGLVLPADMDGVPGLSFHGIPAGATFTYRFPIRQNGTYWYHGHSGFQEQTGVYGPIIIEPRTPEPFAYDREHVVLLSDWTDRDPYALYRLLKKDADYFNYNKRTVGDFVRDARRDGTAAALADRREWARMRMDPSDLTDIGGAAYTYLLNGVAPAANWTGLFRPGERVRLRLINGSSMSTFDVRIPGLAMTVVAADGQHVHPITVEELRIAAAEVLDVLVTPTGADAFTIFAQSLDRSGYARGTLAVREGLDAPVPALDRIVLLGMTDMGHGAHGTHAATTNAPADAHTDGNHGDHAAPAGDAHTGHDMSPGAGAAFTPTHAASESDNPGVDMQVQRPSASLDDPGVGLRGNGRRVLTYADLTTLLGDPDGREPERTIELHLTGHMQRFMWSFDGVPFGGDEPIPLRYGERVRFRLVNDTLMLHPIHLHGMWSDLEDEQGRFKLRKHTLVVAPGSVRSYRVTADALGRWAYHCHLLYHMEAGMFREVRVDE